MMEELQKWIESISSTLKSQQEQIDGLLKLNQEYVQLLKDICSEIKELKNKETQIGLSQGNKKE